MAGATLLARGRPEGMVLMESTPAGAWRSFIAAAICLPAFLALRFFGWAQAGVGAEVLGRPLLAEIITYSLGWLVFPLVSFWIAETWGRGAAWPRFIAAWNWITIVQYLLWLALSVPVAVGASGLLLQGLTLACFGYLVWLEWFTVRVGLGVTSGRATAVVFLDLLIGLFLAGLAQRLSLG
ncbi:hypothetical protein [Falsiroseomonas sp.]|jgi:hypothetical protein|uniref:hypothetical protein n=1 Tax=Falsiroseomonas sp. TaxID=2870721 RepID=UPI003F7128E9